MGDLAETIRNATAGVVPQLLTDLANCTVTTTRNLKTRDTAQRPTINPTHPISGGQWYVREVADAHVQRVWGATANVTMEASVPIGTDVQENDVVSITAGDFAGTVLEINQLRRQPLGNKIDIALGPTGQAP